MAPGIRALRKIQLGREAIPGTKVDADIIWRGTGSIHDNMDLVFPTEDIGMLVPVGRSYIARYEAGLTLNDTEATFEQLPHLFEMGIESVTPTPTGTSDYTYTYIMPYASTDLVSSTDLATYTVEGGDNAAAEGFGYGFARSISLTGSAGQALMMSAEIVGRQVEAGAFTTGIAIADVEEILFGMGKLYISDVKAFPATDLISNQLLGMSLSINTGWLPVYTADGALYFSFIKQTTPEVTLQITFEHDDTAIAEKVNWRAQTPRIIRLLFTGTDGKSLAIDIAGKWASFDVLGEQDGNDIVSGTFVGTYNSTVGGMFQVAITNLLATLP
jgi:hypothetical protein